MNFISDYFNWHYLEVWPKLLLVWRNLSLFPFYYFSVPLHLHTLFSYWKRQKKEMGVSFRPSDFFAVISFNLVSRGIGFVIRSITILYGLIMMLVLFILFLPLPIIWVVIPILTLPLYFARNPSKEKYGAYLLGRANGDLRKLIILILKSLAGKYTFTHLGLFPEELLIYFINQKDKGNYQLFAQILKKRASNPFISHILSALSQSYAPFSAILSKNNIKPEDVESCAQWYEVLETTRVPIVMNLARIKALRGMGTDWAFGYTTEFDRYASDVSKEPTSFPILIGREKELSTLEQILVKTHGNNALVVGEPGTGRRILIETLAWRFLSGNCQKTLSHKRILSINMQGVIGGKPSIPEVKSLAESLLSEAASAGNIIVKIDEIDRYVATREGRVDLSDVITELANSNVGLIGITTPEGYHKYIETVPGFSSLFEKVEVDPPSPDIVLAELQISIVPVLERKYDLIVTYQALKKTIEDSDRYISSVPYPGKAIGILDGACAAVSVKNKQLMVLPHNIDEFFSEKFQIPAGIMQKEEKEKLANLEILLHARIINQEEAVSAISHALRRARLNISSTKKPIGTFLFLGPTGVGKTETAKALASIYYGNEESMFRFDMSQYQKEEGIERLIGSLKLGTPGELTSKLLDRPFSLVLFDEFEKSEKVVFNLMLTLIDEGYITDSRGKKVDARNTIIIATSNAGGEYVRECINQGISGEALNKALIEYVQRENIFSPELLNRFDGVIVFSPLSEGHLREIARLMLADLNKRLVKNEISLEVTPDLIKKLAAAGFDPQFGGRAIRRVIAEKIEDTIAQRLLKGEVKKGEKMRIEI